MKVSTNSYYNWKNKDLTQTKKTDLLRNRIQEIFDDSKQVYGSPKIQKELEREGFVYSRSYVGVLMKQMGIMSILKRKFTITTDSNHSYPLAKNELDRDFSSSNLGEKWVSDITYIRVNDDWNYLTTIMDLADRKIVGWFSGYDIPQESLDLSLKFHLINKKSIGYGMRYGRMKSAPMKMCLVLGNEFYLNRSINGLKAGLDFTPFYRVNFSTLARHEDFSFSDFLYYSIGQLYIRANYIYYFDRNHTYSQNMRPEIGVSPYFKLGEKRNEKLKEKGVYRFYYFYLHPTISYGYDIMLRSNSNFNINKHHVTVGISLSYEKVYPWNSRL